MRNTLNARCFKCMILSTATFLLQDHLPLPAEVELGLRPLVRLHGPQRGRRHDPGKIDRKFVRNLPERGIRTFDLDHRLVLPFEGRTNCIRAGLSSSRLGLKGPGLAPKNYSTLTLPNLYFYCAV